jgi:dTDP-4-dehydrorhamnose reductase
LLNQIDATRLAMAQIRQVRPDARLIQTEDLGRTYATRGVAHQADFDNARRWMTWDLLEGRVVPGHALWSRLEGFGFAERLMAIADDPCPPDIVGVNHYLTSDRFLDCRTENYPPERAGRNEFMTFADVEAVRAVLPAPAGLEGALDEAWARYGRTLAVTESHNGCTREEQVRWIRDAWQACERLRGRGAQVEAVTAWALLGAHDWNTLLTERTGHYEVGAFDIRSDPPRATAVAAELRRLAQGGAAAPGTQGAGWWRRDIRLRFKPVFRTVETPSPRAEWRSAEPLRRPLLIVGATGTLGKALARACEWRGLDYRLTARSELDLTDDAGVQRLLDELEPWAVVNAAGWVKVDEAQIQAAACMAANLDGAVTLARACLTRDLPMVGFSTDLIFDGRRSHPYVESDAPCPLSIYGVSKARAEAEILGLGGRSLMVRTAAFFSPYDPHNFAAQLIRALASGQAFAAAEDLTMSPTYVPHLVDAVLDLLLDGETGLRHLANPAVVSWHQFATLMGRSLDLDETLIQAVPAASFGWFASRPAYSALGTERGQIMPSLESAVAEYAAVIRDAQFEAEINALTSAEGRNSVQAS